MRDFLHRHVLHNLGLKLISLGLATVVWLAVARDPIAEVAVDVAIEFHNIPQNLEISSENIPKAQIRLRGPERVVHGLKPSDVYAEIELSGLKPGERTFDLTAKQIHEPPELEVVQVVPSQFHLAFDTRLTRQVPVQPRIAGTFPPGYALERVEVDPPAIIISGPKKHVEAVESAITDPLDVSGAINRATFVRHAYVSDPLIQVASPDPVRITVIMQKAPAATSGGTQSPKPE
jgi:YbbR domain-containing protein